MSRPVPATPTFYGQDALDLIAYLERDPTPEEIEEAKKCERIYNAIKFVKH